MSFETKTLVERLKLLERENLILNEKLERVLDDKILQQLEESRATIKVLEKEVKELLAANQKLAEEVESLKLPKAKAKAEVEDKALNLSPTMANEALRLLIDKITKK